MPTPTSKRTTAPSFQFYPSDFLASSKVDDMSMTERGIYITLLCKCWLDNGLPNDLRRLAKMVDMKQPQFERVWNNGLVSECFHLVGGRFHNKRLDVERQKQKANRQRQSDNAKARWQKGGNADAMPSHQSGTTRAESREERSGDPVVLSSKEEKEAPIDKWLFDIQNGLYPPHRVSRSARTSHAFCDAMLGYPGGAVEAFRVFCANLSDNIASHEWRVKGMIPSLEKYVLDGLWLNVHPKYPPASERMSRTTTVTANALAEIMEGDDE